MIYDSNKKRLTSISYFDENGVNKIINRIYVGITGGSLKLVWSKENQAYLIVSPTLIWITDYAQQVTIQSNLDWILEIN